MEFRQGRVPTQVRVGKPDIEGGEGGVGPNQIKMWSSLGCLPTLDIVLGVTPCYVLWLLLLLFLFF